MAIADVWAAETPEQRTERIRRGNALWDWHQEWSAQQAANGVDGPVPPGRKSPSDYNQHVPDLESSGEALDEFHTRAREILGLPPL